MRGSKRDHAGWCIVLLLACGGCGDAGPKPPVLAVATREPSAPPSETPFIADTSPSSSADFANAGTVRGQVTWQGPLPAAPLYKIPPILSASGEKRDEMLQPNPNLPEVDPQTRAVKNAVVFLRGVDRVEARPWDLPPVRVEHRAFRFHVRQGKWDSHYGFVRRGDWVEFVSRQKDFHSVRAGGAAFFSLPLPDPDRPARRRLTEKGLVELTSAAGHYWMRAYLFVDDHPYYTLTDAEGRFALERVPPGDYEVICWMPNWHEARHEREPEAGLIVRLFFHPPAEKVRRVHLEPAEAPSVPFVFSLAEFPR